MLYTLVMGRRGYGQFCGLAHAVTLVGERWALLIIRDLLVGPRRFTDLRQGLPRIPTNVLSTRLKELEGAGVVQRRVLPRPDGSVVYELTKYGRQLEAVVAALGRWGAQTMGEPGPDDVLTEASLIMALRATFRPDAAVGSRVGYEVHAGDVVIHAVTDDGTLDVAAGALAGADLVIETGPALRALMTGEVSPADAVAGGSVRLTGPHELLTRFVETFHIPL
jgi:DNA-binding HxlR family transcriptional regulator